MMHLFFNAVAASAGAGLTYVRNVVPEIAIREDIRATFALTQTFRQEFEDFPNITFIDFESAGAIRRYWHEQSKLPKIIRELEADVLISTGNFALRKSPVPQILLSGNSLYTSTDFYHDLQRRRDYAAYFDTRAKAILAKYSVMWADVTVAPSYSFAKTLHDWTGKNVVSIYHGFNKTTFFREAIPFCPDLRKRVNVSGGALKLLFVSHYNYYRNFETLLKAIPIIRDGLGGRALRLFLTCKFSSGANPGTYRAEAASDLVRNLGIVEEVVELGGIPYHSLHHLYRAADIYVTPAYAETFAHPLVEAMACELPIVAADIPVHHEICGKSALFFDRFSPEELADRVLKIASSFELTKELKSSASARSADFSWQQHVDKIVEIAQSLMLR